MPVTSELAVTQCLVYRLPKYAQPTTHPPLFPDIDQLPTLTLQVRRYCLLALQGSLGSLALQSHAMLERHYIM